MLENNTNKDQATANNTLTDEEVESVTGGIVYSGTVDRDGTIRVASANYNNLLRTNHGAIRVASVSSACPLCGAPTTEKTVAGVQKQSCTVCGWEE